MAFILCIDGRYLISLKDDIAWGDKFITETVLFALNHRRSSSCVLVTEERNHNNAGQSENKSKGSTYNDNKEDLQGYSGRIGVG